MSTDTKQSIQDKLASQMKAAHTALDTLKAKASIAKAQAELKAITDLQSQKDAIERKLNDLKKSEEPKYEQAKTDVESLIAALESSVKAIEAKLKAA
jgi:hypothetical protein